MSKSDDTYSGLVNVAEGTYMILNLVSSTGLRPQNNASVDGAFIVGYDRRPGQTAVYEYQQWIMTLNVEKRAYTFKNVASGKYLSTLQDWAPWNNQLCVYLSSKPDYFQLRQGTQNCSFYVVSMRYPNQVLDLWGGSAGNDTYVVVNDIRKPEASNSLSQQWSFVAPKKLEF